MRLTECLKLELAYLHRVICGLRTQCLPGRLELAANILALGVLRLQLEEGEAVSVFRSVVDSTFKVDNHVREFGISVGRGSVVQLHLIGVHISMSQPRPNDLLASLAPETVSRNLA